MSHVEEILKFNKKFIKEGKLKARPVVPIVPRKKMAIITCMDGRLSELLQQALNLKDGDAKIIRNAGATVTHPFGSVMRSLMIAVYQLGVEDILVIGHKDCGVQNMKASKITRKIEGKKLDFIGCCGVDVSKWLEGFDNLDDSVRSTVNIIKTHPLMPSNIRVHGFIIDPADGKLEKVSKT